MSQRRKQEKINKELQQKFRQLIGYEYNNWERRRNILADSDIITTSEEKVDKEAARKLGVSGYIVKPFKINNPASMDSFNLMIDLMNMKD